MATAEHLDLRAYCLDTARRARAASRQLAQVDAATKAHCLRRAAELLHQRSDQLLAANTLDVAGAARWALSPAQLERLRFDAAGIESMATALVQIAALDDPVGEIIESTTRPNQLEITKVRVPLGVVFFIYESRPNVTADAAAICLKSGNAVILRGGKEAAHSNRAIVEVLTEAAAETGLPHDAIQWVATADRTAVSHFLALDQWIDLVIPRGGEALIRRVVDEARMPVLKHFTGNCHVYVDASADLDMAERILINAKCQRMGVCNAAESLLVHARVANEFLPRAARQLALHGVELRGDQRTRELVPTARPATPDDYAAEFLGPILSVKIVSSLDEAIEHINQFGSHHTDSIVTQDEQAAHQFAARVDSAAVMVNASTRFNDGGQFGLGAEIGISTDKLHARGPCGVKELTTYKYIVRGAGQVRE